MENCLLLLRGEGVWPSLLFCYVVGWVWGALTSKSRARLRGTAFECVGLCYTEALVLTPQSTPWSGITEGLFDLQTGQTHCSARWSWEGIPSREILKSQRDARGGEKWL